MTKDKTRSQSLIVDLKENKDYQDYMDAIMLMEGVTSVGWSETNQEELRYKAEEYECAMKLLDECGAPLKKAEKELSIVGRMKGMEDVKRRIQDEMMRYDPATGEERPYPSHSKQWREWHGETAWIFNPWTGKQRDARDIGTDVNGVAIVD